MGFISNGTAFPCKSKVESEVTMNHGLHLGRWVFLFVNDHLLWDVPNIQGTINEL